MNWVSSNRILLAFLMTGLLVAPAAQAEKPSSQDDAIARLQKLGAGVRLIDVGQAPYLEVIIIADQWQGADEDYAQLANMQSKISLDISRAGATPAALEQLAKAASLTQINLSGASLGDAHFEQLGKIASLRTLRIDHAQFDGRSLAHLRGLTELRSLTAADSRIDDRGVAHLATLKKLQLVMLLRTKVSDASVTQLRKALPDTSIIK